MRSAPDHDNSHICEYAVPIAAPTFHRPLIVTELSRLGPNTAEIIALVNELVKRGIRLIALKQHIDLSTGQHDMNSKIIVTVFSLLAELERDLMSMRACLGMQREATFGRR